MKSRNMKWNHIACRITIARNVRMPLLGIHIRWNKSERNIAGKNIKIVRICIDYELAGIYGKFSGSRSPRSFFLSSGMMAYPALNIALKFSSWQSQRIYSSKYVFFFFWGVCISSYSLSFGSSVGIQKSCMSAYLYAELIALFEALSEKSFASQRVSVVTLLPSCAWIVHFIRIVIFDTTHPFQFSLSSIEWDTIWEVRNNQLLARRGLSALYMSSIHLNLYQNPDQFAELFFHIAHTSFMTLDIAEYMSGVGVCGLSLVIKIILKR